MRRASGLIVPGEPEVKLYKSEKSGCHKRRLCGRADTKHCICGLRLKTRRGETRCPTHGAEWAPQYWELTEVRVS